MQERDGYVHPHPYTQFEKVRYSLYTYIPIHNQCRNFP